MKKYLVATMLFLSASIVHADNLSQINRSSFTQTADTTKCIAGAHYLDSIIVAGATTGGSLTLYNSTWTNTPIISSVSLGTVQDLYFNNLNVAGLCYTTVTNTNGVLIIYKK